MAPRVSLVQAPLGYWQVDPMPSDEELRAHYTRAYFDGSRATGIYASEYTDAELAHKRILVDELVQYAPRPGRVFEVGYGEGFALAALRDRGWEVAGVDFTDEGVRLHNPALLGQLAVGNVFDALDELAGS